MIIPSLLLTLAIVTLGLLANFWRSRRRKQFELEPNCLMTRSPLLFVTGKRSLFYFAKYWNEIPEYLTEHGYEVMTLNLPWRNSKQRQTEFHNALLEAEGFQQKFHLFIDPTTLQDVAPLLQTASYVNVLESVNVVTNSPLERTELTPPKIAIEEVAVTPKLKVSWTWKLHQKWTRTEFSESVVGYDLEDSTYPQILQRAQWLAEREFTKNS